MSHVVSEGTARRAALDGIPTAGKTGTTNAYRDAWFVGYTGNFTCAVWYGNDDYSPTNRMTGGSLPAQTWHDIMVAAHQGVEIKELPGVGAGTKLPPPPARDVAANGAPKPPEIKPGPPPVLTKRGADILVQVEKMLDDAAKTAGKTSSNDPPTPVKPLSSNAIAFPESFAAAAPMACRPPCRARTDRAADLHHLAGADPRHRRRPRRDLDDGDPRHRSRHADDRRLDRPAQDRHRRCRSLFARLDRPQRRTAGRHRRRRRVLGDHRRPQAAARRPLRRGGQRRHAGGAVLDADAVRFRRDIWSPIRCSATASPARRSSAARTAAFEVRVASRSRAGNWLPTGGIERYALMLRLYDTPVGVATRTQRDAPMPSIATVGCP